MSYTVRPISDRTRFTGKRTSSRFSARWGDTEALLLREVRALGGRNLVIEVDVTEDGIRLDGRLYANARPASPAVRVAFESRHGPLSYATDRFPSWQDNVRAIALGLEALRRVDRYAITEHGEQYTGFKALPAGRAMPASHMTRDHALDALHPAAGIVVGGGPVDLDALYRRARAAAHPDRNGGDRSRWDLVEEAGRVLGVAS